MAEGDEQALVQDRELRHRRRVAHVLLAGGGIAVLAGSAGSLMIALLGAGWIVGGAAVASTRSRSR
jgi:hypothetical protein